MPPKPTSSLSSPVTAALAGSSTKAAARDEEILAESTRFFAQRGYRATDVQVIADALGIGKGTIYRAFPTKQALFLACADRGMMRMQNHIQAQQEGLTDPVQKIKSAIRAYFQFFDEDHELIELIIQERSEFKDRPKPTYFEYRDRSIQPWNDLFAALIEQGKVRPFRPEQITDFISNQLYGKLFIHYFAGRTDSLSKDAEDVIEFLFYGFMIPEKDDTRCAPARQ